MLVDRTRFINSRRDRRFLIVAVDEVVLEPEQFIEVIMEQAEPAQRERFSYLKAAEGSQKRLTIARFQEHVPPIVPTVDHVVD